MVDFGKALAEKRLSKLNKDINDVVGSDNLDYVGNLTNALTLLENMDDEYTPRLVRILQPIDGNLEHWWKCSIITEPYREQYESFDKSAAVAVCRGWLTCVLQESRETE